MAGGDRTAPGAVALFQALHEEPYRYGFYSVLRRIECLHADKPRVGDAMRASDEPVRLGQDPSVTFAPATLASFTPNAQGQPSRLAVNFFGLFGPNGPLPLHLTEYARDRLRNADDPTFSRFADIFHHRLLSLFYKTWAAAQPTVNLDRPTADRFALYLGALIGLAEPDCRNRDALPDAAKYFFTGRLSAQTRNTEGLLAMLRYYFQVPMELREFVGGWMEIPETWQMRLGEQPDTGMLGVNTVIGARVWECQQRFRVVVGPLDLADYERMLPGGDSLARMVALIRNYVGDALEWDVQLILKKAQVPQVRLGGGARLGWDTWMAGEPLAADADHLLLNPLAFAA